MTAINTNTASLNAQYFLAKANKEMESSMAKLSSGQKVNSAADDAAGLAIAGRMTSQIKGLNMAIKNANDTVALAQTAEGAMEEVTNMLQRMRELAVQASNGTMNDSDRKSLDAEVQALKTEIDRVSSTTQFNNQNLLDGTFSKSFQIGDKSGQTVDMSINSVSAKNLGIGGDISATSVTGARINNANGFAAGDVKINGQNVGAVTSSDDMEGILKAINDNVRNVKATGHNVFVAKQKGTGVTTAGQLVIKVAELGVGSSNATTYQISASGTMKELVANINAETGGVVAASVNSEGKLVLSNDTGATINVRDNTGSAGAFNAGTGIIEHDTFASGEGTIHNGFITLESTDGTDVTVERGNESLTAFGTDADLEELGFRQISRVTGNDAYTVTSEALGAAKADTAWGENDIKINGVKIYDANILTTSFQGKLDAINAFSGETGVVATAFYEAVFEFNGDTFNAADELVVNGYIATVGASLGVLVTNINADTSDHGIKATANGENLLLQGSNVIGVSLSMTASDGAASSAGTYGQETTFEAAAAQTSRIRLDSIANKPISIELSSSDDDGTHGFLEMNVGASEFDVNSPLFSGSSDGNTAGLSISTTADATKALTSLDAAIEQVSAIRGDLGALQNRLDHTVNNLSSVANNTEGAKSRIVDTDFATETANLTKQQILSQAATSMLAQANQSKQGILALLQG